MPINCVTIQADFSSSSSSSVHQPPQRHHQPAAVISYVFNGPVSGAMFGDHNTQYYNSTSSTPAANTQPTVYINMYVYIWICIL